MADAATTARQFIAGMAATVEQAMRRAFADGVDQWCEEDDEADDDCPDATFLWEQASSRRTRLLTLYLPGVARMAGDLTALLTDFNGQLALLRARGASDAEVAALVAKYEAAITKLHGSISRRIAQMMHGLVWAAAELGHAEAAMSHAAQTAQTRRGGRARQLDWVTDPRAENCVDCLSLEAGSPYASIADIGTVPGGDQTRCMSNCRCRIVVN